MHIRRRGRDRMNQLGLAIHTNMRLHAEVPLVALLRLMHLGIPRLGPVLRRTGRTDDSRVHDGASAHGAARFVRYSPIRAKSCWPNR